MTKKEKEIKAFVIQPTYKIEEKKGVKTPIVYLWCRLENGKSALVKKEFTPRFFIKKTDEKKAKKIISEMIDVDNNNNSKNNNGVNDNYNKNNNNNNNNNSNNNNNNNNYNNYNNKEFTSKVTFKETEMKSMIDDELVTKIEVTIPSDIPKIREKLEKQEITCFEADIRYPYAAMMEFGIRGSFIIKNSKSKPTENKLYDEIYENPEIETFENYTPKLTILSFDIESDKHTGQIYCLSSYGYDSEKNYKKEMIIIGEKAIKGLKEAVIVENEKELIKKFCETIKTWNPDIITGWNVIDFDLHLLSERAKINKVSLDIGRDGTNLHLRIESGFFRDSKANINGRVVLDGIQLLKSNHISLKDYKLATAAREYTKEKKLIEETGKEKYEEITRMFKEDKKKLLEYNFLDAKLVIDILQNSGVLTLTTQRSLLVGMPLDRVSASIASVDSLYIRELHKRNYVAPSTIPKARDNAGVGGFVMKSKPGIYDYVIVCDFKSLYPSIMRTFNIDPLKFVKPENVKKYKDSELIKAPNDAYFKKEQGIIPGIIENFWKARDEAKKRGDELARYAIKIHMNSIYGVLASPNSRYFDRMMGNAITGFAQIIIKLTAKEIEKKGYEVIYGDTDSTFVNLNCKDYESSQKIGKKIEKEINNFIKKHIEREYNLKSYLELEFEKTYIGFVMPTVRGSEKGAKKRYAGLILKKDGTEEISFTGLEMVRRDWTDLAKKFQYELYRRIFAKEEIESFVQKFVKDIKKGKFDKKLVYRKALRKDVSEYTKTTPPHVKAALKLDSIESNLIEYVLTVDGPEPVSKITHKIDYKHYIDKQIKPIADSLLTLYNTSFDEQLSGNKQKSLFDF